MPFLTGDPNAALNVALDDINTDGTTSASPTELNSRYQQVMDNDARLDADRAALDTRVVALENAVQKVFGGFVHSQSPTVVELPAGWTYNSSGAPVITIWPDWASGGDTNYSVVVSPAVNPGGATALVVTRFSTGFTVQQFLADGTQVQYPEFYFTVVRY